MIKDNINSNKSRNSQKYDPYGTFESKMKEATSHR